jgi:hypothetical protein
MITVGMNGGARMANQMWCYALLRSVAERTGHKFYFDPKLWLGASLFDLDYGEKEVGKMKDFFELPGQRYNPEVFNVEDFTCLQGYWQSEKYWDREQVKKWFVPKITEKAVSILSEMGTKSSTCFINVRGTDQKLPHLTLDDEYYERAIRIIQTFKPGIDFVVITDDIELGREYFPHLKVMSNDRDTDFCLLHSARYVIGAISTFAWWACYLQDYQVSIFPKYFYHHKTQGVEGCSGWGPMDIHTNKFIWI